jgi:hypothetical protein
LIEWFESPGGVWYETVVKVYHSDEPLERLDINRLGISLDGFDFGWERSDPVLVDPMAEEIDLGYTELAFFQLDD